MARAYWVLDYRDVLEVTLKLEEALGMASGRDFCKFSLRVVYAVHLPFPAGLCPWWSWFPSHQDIVIGIALVLFLNYLWFFFSLQKERKKKILGMRSVH